jgi:hypothetical protein
VDLNEDRLQETWDRLVILLAARPRGGWEREFAEIARREADRLRVPDREPEDTDG